jgi:thiamine-phosphate pyrophosphorylase
MKVYALCDRDALRSRKITLEQFVQKAQERNATVLQYRNKSDNAECIHQELVTLRSLWKETLLVNDYYELVSLCDGIHIGQEDLYALDPHPHNAIAKLKQIIGETKIIGLSTHNRQEINIANGLAIDYIGLGAYRATSTKKEAAVLGEDLDTLASYSLHPVGAIGGVRLDDTFDYVTYLVIGTGLL